MRYSEEEEVESTWRLVSEAEKWEFRLPMISFEIVFGGRVMEISIGNDFSQRRLHLRRWSSSASSTVQFSGLQLGLARWATSKLVLALQTTCNLLVN